MGTDSLNFAKRCEFSLKVDDIVSEIPISDTSFTLYDSIYNIYPKATLHILDTSAIYTEYMGFVNGTSLEISYGETQESWKKCKYTIIENSLPEQNNPSTWGGKLELSLIHEYFAKQTKISKAYKSNISDIINSLIKEYPFNLVDVESTLNSGLWFQPYITNADFIQNYLLPFSYSTSASNSPFYCFIDSNNNFHFKSYASLFKQNPKKTLYLRSRGIATSVQQDTILSFSYAQISVSKLKEFYNQIPFKFDENGNLKKEQNIYFTDYFKSGNKLIPIKVDTNNVTNIVSLYDEDVPIEETQNNNLGLSINKTRESLNVDKIVITIPFTRELCAGDLITLNLPSPTGEESSGENSLRFSDNFLIEASYQKWDGLNSYTMLVCSKQSVRVTDSYRNKNTILKS